jgi:hypothetical protein
MRVLGSGPGAQKTAEALDLELDAFPSPEEASYVAVLEGPGAWAGYQSLVESGTIPLAIVAWRVPSNVLARLAPSSPPIVVGIPDPWSLQVALERGNDPETIVLFERQARLEGYLATPPPTRKEP